MTAFLLLCFLALQGTFIWARHAVFRVDGPTPSGVRLIEVSVACSIVVGSTLIASRPDAGPWRDAVACAALGASAGLFRWGLASVRRQQLTAAFSLDAPAELLRTGAFGFVRHPFYTAYIGAHAVPAVATGSGWAALLAIGMAALYFRAALLSAADARACCMQLRPGTPSGQSTSHSAHALHAAVAGRSFGPFLPGRGFPIHWSTHHELAPYR